MRPIAISTHLPKMGEIDRVVVRHVTSATVCIDVYMYIYERGAARCTTNACSTFTPTPTFSKPRVQPLKCGCGCVLVDPVGRSPRGMRMYADVCSAADVRNGELGCGAVVVDVSTSFACVCVCLSQLWFVCVCNVSGDVTHSACNQNTTQIKHNFTHTICT